MMIVDDDWLGHVISYIYHYQVTVQHDAPGDEGHDVERQSEKPISIPACADFYISYATAPGFKESYVRSEASLSAQHLLNYTWNCVSCSDRSAFFAFHQIIAVVCTFYSCPLRHEMHAYKPGIGTVQCTR